MKIMELALFTLISIGTMAAFETKAQEANLISQDEASKKFIEDIGNQAITILVDRSISSEARQQKFFHLLNHYFEMSKISEFVLGRYWHIANSAQKEKYIELFKKELVKSYAKKFEDYNKEKLEITGVRKSKDSGMFVSSKIIHTLEGTAPLIVEWKVYETPQGLRIFDVFINGVSMSITYRNEYGRLLGSQGGNIEALLKNMESNQSTSTESEESEE